MPLDHARHTRRSVRDCPRSEPTQSWQLPPGHGGMLRAADEPVEHVASQPNQGFAAVLRRHRLLAGLSQEALAERSGLSVRGISDLERGIRRAPHPSTIARLSEALGLDDVARQALLLAATDLAPTPEAP